MMEFPGFYLPWGRYPIISPWAPLSGIMFADNEAPVSTAWPAANRAIYIPVRVVVPILVQQAWWSNGGTVSGNVDLGLYTRLGRRLISTGSTAQAGASALQVVSITDQLIGGGLYYVALTLNNATGTIFIRNLAAGASGVVLKMVGGAIQASAFPLPATFTLATVTDGFCPVCGFSGRAVV